MPVRLNTERFDELVARAGMTHAEIAIEAGISPITVSHARHGRPLRPSTLRALARALSRVKMLPALDGLIAGIPVDAKAANQGDGG